VRPNAIFAGIYVAVLSAGTAFASPLPLSEVVGMSRSGVRSQDVIERLRVSQTSYALRGSDFGKLKAAGVSDEVLDYLQQSFVSSVDQLTRYSIVGPRLGGCSYCYPQPVDVDRMVSGFGIASSEVPGRHPPGLPAGVPDWVLLGPSGSAVKEISVSEIVDAGKHGASDAQIIDLLRHSRLEHVIGVARSNVVREHLTAGLTGAQFAQWRSQGVPDSVLDALQGRFIGQLVELDRLRYQNWF